MADSKKKYHNILADYFTREILYLDEPVCRKPNIRKCMEQPWQQTRAEMWDEVTDTLCNLDFIQAKAVVKKTYDLVNDFNEVLAVIPDNAENIRQEKVRQERMDKYTRDLIACAEGKITIDKLEIPESITPWPQEKIDDEFERMKTNHTRADRLNMFLNFLGVEMYNLQQYAADFPHFAVQQAWNYADEGPVGRAAETPPCERLGNMLLYPQTARPYWNPLPVVLKKLTGHAPGGLDSSMTPNGKLAVSNLADPAENTFIVWDIQTGMALKTLEYTSRIRALSITPDGKYAISGAEDKTCCLWDLESGKMIKILEGHSGFVKAVSITPDGRLAVSGSYDNTCILWDLESGQVMKKLTGHKLLVTAVYITPDGRYALSGSWDKTCILWELETGRAVKTLVEPNGMITSLSMTPDCRYAVTGSSHKTSIFWDLITGQPLTTFTGHNTWVDAVDLTPDGRLAISGSENTCHLWETGTGLVLKSFTWHTDRHYSIKITSDGTRFISCSGDSTILWNSENGQRLKKEEENIGSVIRPESVKLAGNLAITASYPKREGLCLWDLKSGKIIKKGILAGENSGFENVSIVPGNKFELVSSIENSCILFDIRTEKILKRLAGHNDTIRNIVVATDGKNAISTDFENGILWDLETGRVVSSFSEGGIVKLTPDGKCAIFGNCLWSLETGEKIHSFMDRDIGVFSITPDGKRVFSGSTYYDFLWDLETGKELYSFEGRQHSLSAIGITPDGRFGLSGSNGVCILRDLASGKSLRAFTGYSGYDRIIHFTPDGKRAVLIQEDTAGSGNNHIVLWDLETGEIPARFTGTFSIETSAVFPGGLVGCRSADVSKQGGTAIIHASRELLRPGPAIVSALHIWDFEKHSFQGPFADCPLCGTRFQPGNDMVDTIRGILLDNHIGPDDSPCLSLPPEAWDEPALLKNCPSCGETLKFNPFLIEGMDKARIELLSKEFKKSEEEKIQHSISEEQIIQNNIGISTMQFGEFEKAYEYFFKLVFDENQRWKENSKLIYKSNFLLSLLHLKKEAAYLDTLRRFKKTEVQDEKVQKIIRCYVSWKKAQRLEKSKIPFFKRVFDRGNQTNVPLKLDFPPGEYDFD